MGVASLDAAMTEQLLREWPPGYGGVERVAHELAVVWGGTVWSLDAQGLSGQDHDALPVPYRRRRLPCTPPVARLRLPWPSRALWQLLNSKQPLHGHLPSPGVLAVLLLARLINRRRRVTAHWHCFVESGDGWNGRLHALYQRLALQMVPWLSGVVTTSPVLRDALITRGCAPQRVMVLPCCLSQEQEEAGLGLAHQPVSEGRPFKVVFIGRLDSYKRLDWLIEALAGVRGPWQLLVVGDGPRRAAFELLCQQRIDARSRRAGEVLRVDCRKRRSRLGWRRLMCSFCLPIAAPKRLASCSWRRWLPGFLPWPFSVSAQAWVGWGNCLVSPGRSNLKICVRCCRRWRISRRGGFSWGSKPVRVTGSSLPVRCG